MNSLKMMWGGLRYEFLMQIRRPALWLTFLGFAFLVGRSILSELDDPRFLAMHASTLQLAATVALLTNWLAPLGVGIFLADRLPRDRRTRVEELLNTLPGTLKLRLLSKYLGATLATLLPALLLYMLVLVLCVWRTGNLLLFPLGLLCYAVVVLPGMFFVASFSVACPVVIWTPLYQFLFFGYWFWGNLFSPHSGLPTLNGTILTPIGSVIDASFFGAPAFGGVGPGPTPVLAGIASLATLLGLAVLVMIALYRFMRWEQARQ
jgi:ABC-type transport system involved in multi-copper enzyme maturation permease subunit